MTEHVSGTEHDGCRYSVLPTKLQLTVSCEVGVGCDGTYIVAVKLGVCPHDTLADVLVMVHVDVNVYVPGWAFAGTCRVIETDAVPPLCRLCVPRLTVWLLNGLV